MHMTSAKTDAWKNPLTNWTDSRLLTHIHTAQPISLTCKSLVWLWESNGTLEEPEGATVFANHSTAMHKFLYWKIRNVLILFSPFISQWGLNLDIGTFFFLSFSLSVAREEAKIGLKPAFRSRALCSRCEPDSSYVCLAAPRGASAGRQKGSPFRSVAGTRAVVVKQAPGGAVLIPAVQRTYRGQAVRGWKIVLPKHVKAGDVKPCRQMTSAYWWGGEPSADSFTCGLSGLHKTWHFWMLPCIHKNSMLDALFVLQTASSQVFGFTHQLATLSGKMFNYSTNS